MKLAPSTWATAPNRQTWEMYRGEEYLVFIDESAYQFFGFQNPDGNFCHATVGVPRSNYARLQASITGLVRDYEQQVCERLGITPTELRHRDLRQLPYRFRRRVGIELRTRLGEFGGFIAGFFTPTRGFVMEHVRESLLDHATEVPLDHAALFQTTAENLRSQYQGTGQADLITHLLWLPIAALVYFLGSFGCPFKILYDPREKQEDETVRAAIAGLVDRLVRNIETQFTGLYRGMEITKTSEQERGLQLADLIAGEVRNFFLSQAEFLSFGSTLQLVTPRSYEPLQEFREFNGRLFKTGRVLRMPPRLRNALLRPNRGTLLPYFRNLLAAGLLTCITNLGQERDIRVFEGTIFDLCD